MKQLHLRVPATIDVWFTHIPEYFFKFRMCSKHTSTATDTRRRSCFDFTLRKFLNCFYIDFASYIKINLAWHYTMNCCRKKVLCFLLLSLMVVVGFS